MITFWGSYGKGSGCCVGEGGSGVRFGWEREMDGQEDMSMGRRIHVWGFPASL